MTLYERNKDLVRRHKECYTCSPMKDRIIVYGAVWCGDCKRSQTFLDDNNIEYEYISIDESIEAALKVEKINKGLRSIPTIVFPDGQIFVEPTNEELAQKLHILT